MSREALGQGVSDWEQRFVACQKPADAGAWRRAILDQEANTLSAFKELDASLEGSVKATRVKMEKLLDKLDQQARRAVRRQCAPDLERLQELHADLHPAGGGQERGANLWALLSAIQVGDAEGLTRIMESGFDRGMMAPCGRPGCMFGPNVRCSFVLEGNDPFVLKAPIAMNSIPTPPRFTLPPMPKDARRLPN